MQYQKDFAAWEKRQAGAPSQKIPQGRGKKKKDTDPKPAPPKRPKCQMHKDEPQMFLQLATCLKLFMGTSIDERTIEHASDLLSAYLSGFKRIYGVESMKPNHHWAVHTADQIHDFGPMHDFWTFLTERLNKMLKNMNNNNWGGGRLEISMMRAFGCDSQFEAMAKEVQSSPDSKSIISIIDCMLDKNTEDRGTVQATAACDV